MVANRVCQPESKLGVWARWLETVYLPRCQTLSLHQMYEAMDLLQKHSTEVEEAIFFRTASLMELEVDLVFYDTMTISFSIDIAEETGSDSCYGSMVDPRTAAGCGIGSDSPRVTRTQ